MAEARRRGDIFFGELPRPARLAEKADLTGDGVVVTPVYLRVKRLRPARLSNVPRRLPLSLVKQDFLSQLKLHLSVAKCKLPFSQLLFSRSLSLHLEWWCVRITSPPDLVYSVLATSARSIDA
jgi:hypothetical protein